MKKGYYLLFGVDDETVKRIQSETAALEKSIEEYQRRNAESLDSQKKTENR